MSPRNCIRNGSGCYESLQLLWLLLQWICWCVHPTAAHRNSVKTFLLSDNRVKELFLLKSPWPVIGILAVYLYFVTGKGQKWMKDRKAFELSSIINVYNIVQVFLNLYMGIGVRWLFQFAITKINVYDSSEGLVRPFQYGEPEYFLYRRTMEWLHSFWPNDAPLLAHIFSDQNFGPNGYGKYSIVVKS